MARSKSRKLSTLRDGGAGASSLLLLCWVAKLRKRSRITCSSFAVRMKFDDDDVVEVEEL